MTPLRTSLQKSAAIGTNGNPIWELEAAKVKAPAKYKARQELVAHWQSEMTLEERESLRPECVKNAPSQNLLDAGAAKALAIQHLFEQVSLKSELHIAGMLLRRRIARVGIAEALAWVKSDPLFVRIDPDGTEAWKEQSDSISASRYFGERQTLCLYWPLATVVIAGPKVLDFYAVFCANRVTCLKADGNDIKVLNLILSGNSDGASETDPSKDRNPEQ
jgi:hypothetical protein